MILQGFHIGRRDWWIMVYYDVSTDSDLGEVADALSAIGLSRHKVEASLDVLSGRDSGMTCTDYGGHTTLMFISSASSLEQMFDTIQHETRHAADHISEYYGLDARGEESAYLQGEIARKMFPAAAMVMCPRC